MDNISYICDRQRPCFNSSSCGKECIRTCYVEHALNWDHVPDIEDLRLYFDVLGYGEKEKWIEKDTKPIIEGGTENGRKKDFKGTLE